MKIVFLCRYFWPHRGGVENQVLGLSRELVKKKHQVWVITLKYSPALLANENYAGIKIIRLAPLPIKFFGLLWLWFQLFKLIQLIKAADIVHAHSVLIWYWPLKLVLPHKPVFVTWHGWEGIYPVPFKNRLIRKLDRLIAVKAMAIHDYLEKYYQVKPEVVLYPAIFLPKEKIRKKDWRRLVYAGRLDEDTGLKMILAGLARLKDVRVDWCGDGPLADDCRRFGPVHGWTNPAPYYQQAGICLSAGVTSIMEAMSYKCRIITVYNQPLKKDYLLKTPFKNWITAVGSAAKLAQAIRAYRRRPEKYQLQINRAYDWVKTQSWRRTVNTYLQLWQ